MFSVYICMYVGIIQSVYVEPKWWLWMVCGVTTMSMGEPHRLQHITSLPKCAVMYCNWAVMNTSLTFGSVPYNVSKGSGTNA